MAIFYLDIDDEITSAAARIRGTEDLAVVLVLPAGSRIATSRINFRLLAREAQQRSRRLSIVAPDASARALAATAGLAVYASTLEYESSLPQPAGTGSEDPDRRPPGPPGGASRPPRPDAGPAVAQARRLTPDEMAARDAALAGGVAGGGAGPRRAGLAGPVAARARGRGRASRSTEPRRPPAWARRPGSGRSATRVRATSARAADAPRSSWGCSSSLPRSRRRGCRLPAAAQRVDRADHPLGAGGPGRLRRDGRPGGDGRGSSRPRSCRRRASRSRWRRAARSRRRASGWTRHPRSAACAGRTAIRRGPTRFRRARWSAPAAGSRSRRTRPSSSRSPSSTRRRITCQDRAVSVTAAKDGPAGNVAAGTISVIPGQYNSVVISVRNPAATSGGAPRRVPEGDPEGRHGGADRPRKAARRPARARLPRRRTGFPPGAPRSPRRPRAARPRRPSIRPRSSTRRWPSSTSA